MAEYDKRLAEYEQNLRTMCDQLRSLPEDKAHIYFRWLWETHARVTRARLLQEMDRQLIKKRLKRNSLTN